MSTSNINESPIMNTPISHNASPAAEQEDYEDCGPCCGAQWMPASQCGFYIKFVLIAFAVFGGGSFGLYKLCAYFAS